MFIWEQVTGCTHVQKWGARIPIDESWNFPYWISFPVSTIKQMSKPTFFVKVSKNAVKGKCVFDQVLYQNILNNGLVLSQHFNHLTSYLHIWPCTFLTFDLVLSKHFKHLTRYIHNILSLWAVTLSAFSTFYQVISRNLKSWPVSNFTTF